MLFKKKNFTQLIFNKKIVSALCLPIFILLAECSKKEAKLDPDRPLNAEEKRKKNVKEGSGVSIGDIIRPDRSTNYEFSTSNPMWRASLETLDFLPLSTVDYSGGVIITDWYAEDSNIDEAIKITLRFLSNEIRSDSLKIIIHKKKCSEVLKCKTTLMASNSIKDELRSTILRKASQFEKESKPKK